MRAIETIPTQGAPRRLNPRRWLAGFAFGLAAGTAAALWIGPRPGSEEPQPQEWLLEHDGSPLRDAPSSVAAPGTRTLVLTRGVEPQSFAPGRPELPAGPVDPLGRLFDGRRGPLFTPSAAPAPAPGLVSRVFAAARLRLAPLTRSASLNRLGAPVFGSAPSASTAGGLAASAPGASRPGVAAFGAPRPTAQPNPAARLSAFLQSLKPADAPKRSLPAPAEPVLPPVAVTTADALGAPYHEAAPISGAGAPILTGEGPRQGAAPPAAAASGATESPRPAGGGSAREEAPQGPAPDDVAAAVELLRQASRRVTDGALVPGAKALGEAAAAAERHVSSAKRSLGQLRDAAVEAARRLGVQAPAEASRLFTEFREELEADDGPIAGVEQLAVRLAEARRCLAQRDVAALAACQADGLSGALGASVRLRLIEVAGIRELVERNPQVPLLIQQLQASGTPASRRAAEELRLLSQAAARLAADAELSLRQAQDAWKTLPASGQTAASAAKALEEGRRLTERGRDLLDEIGYFRLRSPAPAVRLSSAIEDFSDAAASWMDPADGSGGGTARSEAAAEASRYTARGLRELADVIKSLED